ncbi:hypothetical protein GCM10010869_05910 [Mesorhizobium tianshanense]|uniref:TraH protein n=1 Tax=Mesorhizobium tianshanense TaxID=39844 RepID=A0A562NLP3_9HYPH|nr:TraH protein [Mesorhizobium tianshanense]GLS35003.1 hypothetical protein GCM10010869_05910 [Mesorhizobium tianshanense]
MFGEPDPGDVNVAVPAAEGDDPKRDATDTEPQGEAQADPEDPNKAGIRVDLSEILGSGHKNER